MSISEHELFRRDEFSSIYLTMLGIIQAGVFAFLTHDAIIYATINYTGDGPVEIIQLALADVYMYHVLATLVTILVVTYEYCYFVTFVYRPIRIYDIIILFMLGISEFIIVSMVGYTAGWWFSNFVFTLVGILAFINTLTYNFQMTFGEDKRRTKLARRHTWLQMLVVATAAMYTFVIANVVRSGRVDVETEIMLTMIWTFVFGLVMLIGSDIYVQKITRTK